MKPDLDISISMDVIIDIFASRVQSNIDENESVYLDVNDAEFGVEQVLNKHPEHLHNIRRDLSNYIYDDPKGDFKELLNNFMEAVTKTRYGIDTPLIAQDDVINDVKDQYNDMNIILDDAEENLQEEIDDAKFDHTNDLREDYLRDLI